MAGRYAQSRAAARRRRRPPPSQSRPKLWRPLLLSSRLAVQVSSPRMPLSNKSCVVYAQRLNHIVPLVFVSMVAEEHCNGERGAVTKGATTARARIRFCPRNVFEHACAQGCSAHWFGRRTGHVAHAHTRNLLEGLTCMVQHASAADHVQTAASVPAETDADVEAVDHDSQRSASAASQRHIRLLASCVGVSA